MVSWKLWLRFNFTTKLWTWPISTHLTQNRDQDQETHQLSQVEVEDTKPTYEKNFKTSTQVRDNKLNRQANELVSGQKEDSFSTQLAPRWKMSIVGHIHLDEARKFNNIENLLRKYVYLMNFLVL